ncbi:hypothetical protein H4W33_005910 [Kibdelosporangium phytohabitans]|nr:hypothetical protein [Kibdelosporangium phytohabitans]
MIDGGQGLPELGRSAACAQAADDLIGGDVQRGVGTQMPCRVQAEPGPGEQLIQPAGHEPRPTPPPLSVISHTEEGRFN